MQHQAAVVLIKENNWLSGLHLDETSFLSGEFSALVHLRQQKLWF